MTNDRRRLRESAAQLYCDHDGALAPLIDGDEKKGVGDEINTERFHDDIRLSIPLSEWEIAKSGVGKLEALEVTPKVGGCL